MTERMATTDQGLTRPVDVRARDLWIRLAETPAEVAASQELRFRVFCEEMDAKASREMAVVRREFDSFDEFCDHLLVFDETKGQGAEAVVGSYRLMRRPAAARRGRARTHEGARTNRHGGRRRPVQGQDLYQDLEGPDHHGGRAAPTEVAAGRNGITHLQRVLYPTGRPEVRDVSRRFQ